MIPTIKFDDLLRIAEKSMQYDMDKIDYFSKSIKDFDVIKAVCNFWNINKTSPYDAVSFEFKYISFDYEMDIYFISNCKKSCIRVESETFNNLFILFFKQTEDIAESSVDEIRDVHDEIYNRCTNVERPHVESAFCSLAMLQDLYNNFVEYPSNDYEYLLENIENINDLIQEIN